MFNCKNKNTNTYAIRIEVQHQESYHQQSNLVNSLLSVVGLQVLLYLRLARSKPAKTAVAT